MNKKITLDQWIEVAVALFTDVQKCLSDDGRISVPEAIGLLITFLRKVMDITKVAE